MDRWVLRRIELTAAVDNDYERASAASGASSFVFKGKI